MIYLLTFCIVFCVTACIYFVLSGLAGLRRYYMPDTILMPLEAYTGYRRWWTG